MALYEPELTGKLNNILNIKHVSADKIDVSVKSCDKKASDSRVVRSVVDDIVIQVYLEFVVSISDCYRSSITRASNR